jgi:hypothetical protein
MLIVGYVSERERPQGKMQSSFGPTFSRNSWLVRKQMISSPHVTGFVWGSSNSGIFLKGFFFDARISCHLLVPVLVLPGSHVI